MSDEDRVQMIVALVAAQAEFPQIPKDAVNTYYKSRYATLDAVIKATMPALTAHGLALTHQFEQHAEKPTLTTTLRHVAGGTLHSSCPLLASEGMQGLGSAVTYARRYNICCLLNVCADEDDDGNTAQPKAAKPISKERALVLRAKKRFEAASGVEELMTAVMDVGDARDNFPDLATYKEALECAYAHEPIEPTESAKLRERIEWYLSKHPESVALRAEMEAKETF